MRLVRLSIGISLARLLHRIIILHSPGDSQHMLHSSLFPRSNYIRSISINRVCLIQIVCKHKPWDIANSMNPLQFRLFFREHRVETAKTR